jgi:hypothetical protein
MNSAQTLKIKKTQKIIKAQVLKMFFKAVTNQHNKLFYRKTSKSKKRMMKESFKKAVMRK